MLCFLLLIRIQMCCIVSPLPDVDLHTFDPSNNHIFYGHSSLFLHFLPVSNLGVLRAASKSAGGGRLDIDSNAGCRIVSSLRCCCHCCAYILDDALTRGVASRCLSRCFCRIPFSPRA